MSNFENDLLYGEVGENKLIVYLFNDSKTKRVLDVRKDKYFQAADVDFLQELNDGSVNKIEVKSDRQAHKTGNIVYEVTSNGNAGCLKRSIADYVFYYVSESDEGYIISMRRLNALIAQNRALKVVKMGDNATGYLINIQEALNMGIAKRVEERTAKNE